MIVEAAFWFHPMVWWIGAKLVEERERACDESVIARGNEPRIYAEGILNVCKSYLESPLHCVSGVTGSDLKKRIREILTGRVAGDLNFARKAALALVAMAALAAPIFVGMIGAPSIRAFSRNQNAAVFGPEYKYDVVSIKPDKSGRHYSDDNGFTYDMPPDGFHAGSLTLANLISMAYAVPTKDNPAGIRPDQFWYVPDWAHSERFEVDAKTDASVAEELSKLSPDQQKAARRQMMQVLLADPLQADCSPRNQGNFPSTIW